MKPDHRIEGLGKGRDCVAAKATACRVGAGIFEGIVKLPDCRLFSHLAMRLSH